MEIKDQLTNEQIRMRFTNQFDLVNHAIHLAGNLIRTGREPRVPVHTDNPALQALQEIKLNKDVIEEEPQPPSAFSYYTPEKKPQEDQVTQLQT